MNRKKIIIDTDIGDDIDDAFALALALASPELELLGVTTVFKNTRQRAHIAGSLLRAAGRKEVPVFAGLNFPPAQDVKKFSYEVVGADGLARLRHFNEEMERVPYEMGSATRFILDTADKYPGEVTLVGIGPLTNLAAALRERPESFRRLKEIVLMSGFFVEKYPEWNVMCDPEASRAVYTSGMPLRIVGANCTMRTEISGGDLEKLRGLGGRLGTLLNDMLSIWLQDNRRNCVMHDALTIACLYGNFVAFEERNVYVPLEEGVRGYTLCLDAASSAAGRAFVSVDVDARPFLDGFTDRLARFTAAVRPFASGAEPEEQKNRSIV